MLAPDPIWVEKSESCSGSDEESSESKQSEDDKDNPAVDANSFSDGANDEEEEKLPEPDVDVSTPVYSDSSSHQEKLSERFNNAPRKPKYQREVPSHQQSEEDQPQP